MAHRRNRPTLYEVVQHSRKDTPKKRPGSQVPPTTAPTIPPPLSPTLPTEEDSLPADTPMRIPAPVRPERREDGTEHAEPVATSFRWLNGALSLQLAAPSLVVALVALAAWFGLGYYVGQRAAGVERSGDPRDDLALLTAAPDRSGESGVAQPEVPAAPPVTQSTRRVAPPAVPTHRETARENSPETHRPAAATPPPTAPKVAAGDSEVVPAPKPVNTPPANPGTAPEWERGKFYVVLQHFPLSQSKAVQSAQEYLAENGVATAIVRKSDLALIATESFNSADATSALMRKVKQLGKAYAERGGYDFAQAYSRMLRKP